MSDNPWSISPDWSPSDEPETGQGVAQPEAGSAGSAGYAGSTERVSSGLDTPNVAGSAGSASYAGSAGGGGDEPDMNPLGLVRDWLERFITVVDDTDLDLLTLWAAHTHVCMETYTTPRLTLDSPVPGSGKTTVLEHLERLCLHPVQMASLSSPALLTRMLDNDLRTVLIDEADRSLSPDKPEVGELLAVLNSGYKRGATRPVLTPAKGGEWKVSEMPTFAPVVMAGNSPNLPEDTQSRSIRVLLMPDVDGTAEDSDWEVHDDEARRLGSQLASWADLMRQDIAANRAVLPEKVRGRAKERWAPLKRVAQAAGGHWPALVDDLAIKDVGRVEQEKNEGFTRQRPHVSLLTHIAEVWPTGEAFVATTELIELLINEHPEVWGEMSSFGKRLTAQRLGRMLSTHYGVHTGRPDADGPRGYVLRAFDKAFSRLGVTPPARPAEVAEPAEPATDFYDLPGFTDRGPERCGECGNRAGDFHMPSCSRADKEAS